MTPKEKAAELLDKYCSELKDDIRIDRNMHLNAIRCAIICVEQIIDSVEAFGYSLTAYDDFETGKMTNADDKNPTDYWRKVLELLQNS